VRQGIVWVAVVLTMCCRQDWPAEEKVHLGEELSDVMIYLVRLAGAIDALIMLFRVARRLIRVLTPPVISARHPQTSATSTCQPRSRTRWSRTPISIPPSWYALDHQACLDTAAMRVEACLTLTDSFCQVKGSSKKYNQYKNANNAAI
jgi:hypothetical protein